MASYLNPDPDTPLFGVNALKLWLKGDITTPKFLTSENGGYCDRGGRDNFSLHELHRALYIALLEISHKLDPELECVATLAAGVKYCVKVDMDEFYEGRDAEVKSLVDLDPAKRDETISSYDRDAVCEVLDQVREEIGWLEDQARRLEAHMEVAQEIKRIKLRNTFVFRPLVRSWAVSRISQDVQMVSSDAAEVQVDEEEGEKTPGRAGRKEETTEEQEKAIRKERLELFKREADVGFGSASAEETLEEGEVEEQNDGPLVGLGVRVRGKES